MYDTSIKIVETNLEKLYNSMLNTIITYMDEKKITIKDLSETLSIGEEELKSYFMLESMDFAMYLYLLDTVKGWRK